MSEGKDRMPENRDGAQPKQSVWVQEFGWKYSTKKKHDAPLPHPFPLPTQRASLQHKSHMAFNYKDLFNLNSKIQTFEQKEQKL